MTVVVSTVAPATLVARYVSYDQRLELYSCRISDWGRCMKSDIVVTAVGTDAETESLEVELVEKVQDRY